LHKEEEEHKIQLMCHLTKFEPEYNYGEKQKR